MGESRPFDYGFQHVIDIVKQASIHCAHGCGYCCELEGFDATILEEVPLALKLEREDSAAAWYDRLQLISTETPQCALFLSHGLGKGVCSQYRYRPLVCRLFGFSARSNENGVKQPVTGSFTRRLSIISHDLTLTRYSINEALFHALEYVLETKRFETMMHIKNYLLNS